MDTFPTVLSNRHQRELIAAQQAYAEGRFLEAAQAVEASVQDDPDNAFLLNEYARALFRVDSLRPQSRLAYAKLVTLLTDRQSPPPDGVVIDLWFIDAYWKLAMLYLDIGEYERALMELAKVALAPQPDPQVRAQLYTYLAEAYFFAGDRPAAQWFVERTLELEPGNTYVLRFRSQPSPR